MVSGCYIGDDGKASRNCEVKREYYSVNHENQFCQLLKCAGVCVCGSLKSVGFRDNRNFANDQKTYEMNIKYIFLK